MQYRYEQDFEFDLKRNIMKVEMWVHAPDQPPLPLREEQPMGMSGLAEASELSLDDILYARIPFIIKFCYLGRIKQCFDSKSHFPPMITPRMGGIHHKIIINHYYIFISC